MEPTTGAESPVVIYRKGDRVRHPKAEKWGLGEVLARSNGRDVKVFFVGVGYKVLSLTYVHLEKVPALLASSPLLDNLIPTHSEDSVKYQTFEDTLELFLAGYPEGFYDSRYVAGDRLEKVTNHENAIALLNEPDFAELLKADNAAEICKRVLSVVNQTSLIFPNEKTALKKGLANARAQREFADALYTLLHGEGKMRIRFEEFGHILSSFGAGKWQVPSYLMFVCQPDKHMFIKPTVTQQTAELCGFNIKYLVNLNWKTYEHVLKFSDYIFNELAAAGMKPRDMIDVQSFMWCVTLGKYAPAAK